MNQPIAMPRPMIGIACAENDPTPPGESRKNQVGVRYVEAIEIPERSFFLGVQRHPEGLHELPEEARLFKAFAAAARAEKRKAGAK